MEDDRAQEGLEFLAAVTAQYGSGERKEALSRLNDALKKVGSFTESDVRVMRRLSDLWQRTADESLVFPEYVRYRDIEPLLQRALNAQSDGHQNDYLSLAWKHLQYTSVGTLSFHKAVSVAAKAAAAAGDVDTACACVGIFLGHRMLITGAHRSGLVSIGDEDPGARAHRGQIAFVARTEFPLEAAILGVQDRGDAACVKLLELIVELAPPFLDNVRQRAITVLNEHAQLTDRPDDGSDSEAG